MVRRQNQARARAWRSCKYEGERGPTLGPEKRGEGESKNPWSALLNEPILAQQDERGNDRTSGGISIWRNTGQFYFALTSDRTRSLLVVRACCVRFNSHTKCPLRPSRRSSPNSRKRRAFSGTRERPRVRPERESLRNLIYKLQ